MEATASAEDTTERAVMATVTATGNTTAITIVTATGENTTEALETTVAKTVIVEAPRTTVAVVKMVIASTAEVLRSLGAIVRDRLKGNASTPRTSTWSPTTGSSTATTPASS